MEKNCLLLQCLDIQETEYLDKKLSCHKAEFSKALGIILIM